MVRLVIMNPAAITLWEQVCVYHLLAYLDKDVIILVLCARPLIKTWAFDCSRCLRLRCMDSHAVFITAWIPNMLSWCASSWANMPLQMQVIIALTNCPPKNMMTSYIMMRRACKLFHWTLGKLLLAKAICNCLMGANLSHFHYTHNIAPA